MRKIILSMHTSLDGFVGGENGEMNWIKVNDEIFDLVGEFTKNADTALYGRVTYQMMDSYWPTAGSQPDASKHDIEHSNWYNNSEKVVLSKTMKGTQQDKTIFICDNIAEEVENLKKQEGKDILIFGSPSASHSLMENNLIDEYWLFVNPVILGKGIPMFSKITRKIELKLLASKAFSCGVCAMNYSVVR